MLPSIILNKDINMKKLFAILITTLLVSNVFGQTQGVFGRIYDEPDYQRFESFHAEGNVRPYIDGTTPYRKLLSRSYYHFIKDNKLYMLSYGEPSPTDVGVGIYYERKLYLMCWDNGVWSKASDIIQVDQKFENGGIKGYLPMWDSNMDGKTEFGGKVEEVGNCILITLANHYIPDGDFNRSGICGSEITLKKFVLMPNGDGTYSVLHDTKNND